MSENFEEIKYVNKQAILEQLALKTKSGTIVWTQTAPATYQAAIDTYAFYLRQIENETILLTVTFNDAVYTNYNSTLVPEVSDVFSVVDILYGQIAQSTKTDQLIKDLSSN